MWPDLRDSVRSLRKTPAFTVLAIFVLALGIGVNTAIFSLVNAVLFKAPNVRAPGELRYVYVREPRAMSPQYVDYLDLRDQNDVFSGLVAVGSDRARLGSGIEVELTNGESVSANYFDVLGVPMTLGHGFVPGEDESSNPAPTVIISHRLWTRHFHADPDVIGRNLALTRPYILAENQWPNYTIIGVAAEGFTGVASPWAPTDYWVPLVQRNVDYRERHGMERNARVSFRSEFFAGLIIGRKKPGIGNDRVSTVVRQLGEQARAAHHPNTDPWSLMTLDSRRVRLPFDPRGEMVPERLAAGLMVVSGLVLVIAITNLTGMLMARGVTRRQEMAVRLTLGASRWQITRRLFAETSLLAFVGGLAGLGFARCLLLIFADQTPRALGSGFFSTNTIPFALDLQLDPRVLLYTLATCIGASLLIGIAPSRAASKTDLLNVISGGLAKSSRRRVKVRHLILVPQLCLCAALLLIAGVVAKPALEAERIKPGYEPDKVSFVNFSRPSTRLTEEEYVAYAAKLKEQRFKFNTRVLQILSAQPSISAASATMGLPTGALNSWMILRDDFPQGRHWWVNEATITPEYFKTLGIPVTHGRAFDDRDRSDAPKVAIICERFAMWLFQGKNAIGQYIGQHWPDGTYTPEWREIVGVVKEVQPPLGKGGGNPFVYVPLSQGNEYATTIIARGPADSGEVTRAIRQAIFDADPVVEVSGSGTLREQIASVLYPRRMAAGILSASGLIGLILAAAGLYGVISYSVAQRIRELGIRATLGASRFSLMGLVLREGATVAIVGALLGFVVALIGGYLTSHLVVAIPRPDLVTVLIVPAILAVVVLVACFVPARRAARVDPLKVLRMS